MADDLRKIVSKSNDVLRPLNKIDSHSSTMPTLASPFDKIVPLIGKIESNLNMVKKLNNDYFKNKNK